MCIIPHQRQKHGMRMPSFFCVFQDVFYIVVWAPSLSLSKPQLDHKWRFIPSTIFVTPAPATTRFGAGLEHSKGARVSVFCAVSILVRHDALAHTDERNQLGFPNASRNFNTPLFLHT